METSSSSELDFRCSTQHGRQQQQSQYSVEADEFKLVFLNSDSSSSCHGEEEEEEDDTDSSCSTHHCHSIVSNVEDCDWDYFEPSMISTTTTTTTTTMIAYSTARATPPRRRPECVSASPATVTPRWCSVVLRPRGTATVPASGRATQAPTRSSCSTPRAARRPAPIRRRRRQCRRPRIR